MSHAIGNAAWAAAAMIALARLGMPAAGAALLIAAIGAGVLCWIISSGDRADRAERLIGAARGHATERTAMTSGSLTAGVRQRRWRWSAGPRKHDGSRAGRA